MTNMSDRLKETLGIMNMLDESVPLGIPDPMPIDHYIDDPLENPPAIFQKREMVSTIPDVENSDLKEDYVEARNITYTLIDMIGRAMAGALEVAVESQHPKAYDSFNSLATTMRGVGKDLLEYQKIYQSIVDSSKPKVANITQNNINVSKGDEQTVEVTPKKITVSSSITDILNSLDDIDKTSPIEGEFDVVE